MPWQALKNVAFSWLALFTTLVVSFFLTPFLLHRLGDVGFGLWVLMGVFTGYYGLLDLGTRNAIIRYVARFLATKDLENLAAVVSTSLVSYSVLGMGLVVVTALTAWKLELILEISPEWVSTAKALLVIIGLGTAAGLPLNLFAGILEGMQRFAWIGIVQVVSTLLRAGLIVAALNRGYGLLAVGAITVSLNLLSYLVYLVLVLRLCQELRLRWSYVQKSTLQMLAGFGLLTFWIGIAQKLRFGTDALVIGSFLSVQAISMFAISSKLIDYTSEIVQNMAQIFTPMSSQFDARQDMERLRRVLVVGNRYASLVIFPLAAILIFLGPTIIQMWVGSAYLASYPVLVILIVPMTLYLSQAASTKVLYGMGKHAMLARVLFLEGSANLLLSILLIRWYGIVGVALGTAIPLACTSLLFLPRHLCRLLGLRLGEYLREAYGYPLLLSLPLAVVLWLAERWIPVAGYPGMLLKVSAGGMVYGLSVLGYFYWKEWPGQVRSTGWAVERSARR